MKNLMATELAPPAALAVAPSVRAQTYNIPWQLLRIGKMSLALILVAGIFILSSETFRASAQCAGPVQWKQIGPSPLTINQIPNAEGSDGKGPNSGLVSDIAIDPSGLSDQILYVATEGGGVWKSLDGGTNWSPKTEAMPSLTIGTVAL